MIKTMTKLVQGWLGVALVACMVPAYAQSPIGYGTILTLPVVVNTSTFSTEIYIHNPGATSVQVHPWYYGGDGTATVGFVSCIAPTIAANTTLQISLTALCPLNAGSNFGRLRIYETDALNKPIAAYARVNSFSGNGFSVEGFPVGNFGFPSSDFFVNGLKRVAASGGAPAYQTNCFLGALQEAVQVLWNLESSTGTLLGSSQTTNLTANQFVRILDVFTAVGAPAGDHTNVRARFVETTGATDPGFVAFCTVQNNTSFDADFRIAKVFQSSLDDAAKRFTTSVSFNSASTVDGAGNAIPALTGGNSHRWAVFFQHPDWVACSTSGVTGGGGIEIRLMDPAGTAVAGGGAATSFGETFLGEKSTVNSGRNGIWQLQVESNGGTINTYTLSCTSGNGGSTPIYNGTGSDVF